jgi:FkbM family methyltransferase
MMHKPQHHNHSTVCSRSKVFYPIAAAASLFAVLNLQLGSLVQQSLSSIQNNQHEQSVTKPTPRPYRHGTHFNYSFSNIKASACSQEQIDTINNTLGQPNADQIMYLTNCPESNWIDNYYRTKLGRVDSEGQSFLGINIGCNKGYDAVKIARMGTGNFKFNTRAWREAMSSSGVADAGACGQATKVSDSEEGSSKYFIQGEVHCVEPLPSTVRALKNSSQVLGYEEEGLVITQAAISSSDGIAFFPNPPPGNELGNLAACEVSKVGCSEVPMYSLETYVETYVQNQQGPINVLSIDVEGFDFDVLFGAGSVLDRTEYLEFEYHIFGTWKNYHITDAVRLLDGKGFTCYWAGREKLWRITNCYINDLYSWHNWSNMACVHRSQVELADIMENIFTETVR